MAVLDFDPPPPSNSVSYERSRAAGKVISNYFEMILPMAGLKVVNRRSLKAVLDEQRFQMSGLTEGSAIKLGKMVGAKSVLVGQVTNYNARWDLDWDYNITFSCTLLDVETGNILYSGASSLKGSYSFEASSERLVAETVRKMTGK
jgi:hypothetical protein